MSTLLLEKPDKGDTFLYLMVPLAVSALITSTGLFTVDVIVSLDLVVVTFGSLTLYVLRPDLWYLQTKMAASLCEAHGEALEDWVLLAELVVGRWYVLTADPPLLKDDRGRSPHAKGFVESGLQRLMSARVTASSVWRFRVDLFFLVSSVFLIPAFALIAWGIASSVPNEPLFLAVAIRFTMFATLIGVPVSIAVGVWRWKYTEERENSLRQLACLMQALWLMDLVATSSVAGHEKWSKRVFNAISPQLDQVRSIIQLGDWNWFRSRWQEMGDAIALGVKEEIGNVMSQYLEIWGDYLKTPDDHKLGRQLRWFTHILFHRQDLLPDAHRGIVHELALRGNSKPEILAELATVIDLFPETLLSPGPGGSVIDDPKARMLAWVGKRALSCSGEDQASFMHCLLSGLEVGWPPTASNTGALHQPAAVLILRFVVQRAQGEKVGLWSALTAISASVRVGGAERRAIVTRCTALLVALPNSVDRVPVLCDFVLETRDREAIADLLSDRAVVRDAEAMDPRFLNAWKRLPSSGHDLSDTQGNRLIEEQYNRRGLRP